MHLQGSNPKLELRKKRSQLNEIDETNGETLEKSQMRRATMDVAFSAYSETKIIMQLIIMAQILLSSQLTTKKQS